MKRTALIILSLLLGFAVGWVSSRTKEMAEYRRVIAISGLTEEQLAEAYKGIPAMMENMEAEDRKNAIISLAALSMLESDHTDKAKQLLADQAASYFVIYGPPDHPGKKMTEERKSTLEAISTTRSKSPLLDATITKALENVAQ
jgi:hypothetical protein